MLVLEPHTEQTTTTRRQVPLCVDLDGTLIVGDLLWESLVALLRQNLLLVFLLPLWLLRGRAYFKQQIARRVQLDAALLPYRHDVVEFLRQEKEAGRYLVLATGSNILLARAVADYLDLFDEVLASDGDCNLKGQAKLEALQRRFASTGFDYVGDSRADLPLWQAAQQAYLVAPSVRLLRQAEKVCRPARIFRPKRSRLRSLVKLLRPHQWAKNLLLFVPLVLAHQITDLSALLGVVLAFVVFSLCASAVYILNDLLDLQADRRHPTKCRRPLASGAVSISRGLMLLAGLLAVSAAITLSWHSWGFIGWLGVYLMLTTAYSFHLKREPLLDVFVLAGLYTLRIVAGGAAAEVAVTGWLLAFSVFFFLSLALVKRYAELARAEGERKTGLDHRGYRVEDLALIQSVGPASGYMAVLTLCLYINHQDVLRLYHAPSWLWGICFVIFYWITRVWFLARRRQLHEDPVLFATTDATSYLCGLVVAVVLVCATI